MSKTQTSKLAAQAASASLRSGAAVVALREPTPVVKTTDAGAIDTFVRYGAVDVPGVYIAIWRLGDRVGAYVGQSSKSVAVRLHDPKFRHVIRPERIITITARDGRLTSAQTRVIERTLHLTLVESGVPVIGETPAGAVVPAPEFAMLRAFCAAAIRQIQVAGLAFQNLSARDGLAGPVTEPGIVLDVPPAGKRFRLESETVMAEMIETAGDFVITAGSIIHDPGHAPRTRTIGTLRLELAYSGLLEPIEAARLKVRLPLRFATASAATRFVTGEEVGVPSRWKCVEEGDTSSPRRARKDPQAQPVLATLVVSTAPSTDPEPVGSDDRDIDSSKGGFRHGR